MIHVLELVKRYGANAAVDGVSFDVAKGEVVGFLGPNGAGKTTTLRILAGFLGQTSGTVEIAGFDTRDRSREARQRIGYMPEGVPLYPEMRVAEYLRFRAELKRVARSHRRAWVDDAMQKAHVAEVAGVPIGHLSKGFRQRVGLADALVARPPLLVLDEPTAGLDPNQIREVREVVKGLGRDHTVLLSTHILSEVEASCTRVLVLAKGKLVAQGTTEEIAKKRVATGVRLLARGELGVALRTLEALPEIRLVERRSAPGDEDGVHELEVGFGTTVDAAGAARVTETAVAALVTAGVAVREVRPVRGSLEEVFADLTREEVPA